MMYFATNIEQIVQAMEASAPRSVEEIMREDYPDAVFDANGRAHAPHDGYVDPVYGNVYRGGEYLPLEPDDDRLPNNRPVRRFWVYVNGQTQAVDGTMAQIRAGAAVAKEQAAAHDRVAGFVGEEGKRIELSLTLLVAFWNTDSAYPSCTHYFRDENGNSVVWNGSKRLGIKGERRYGCATEFTATQEGETVTVKATVKSHWTGRDGRKATYLTRLSLVK